MLELAVVGKPEFALGFHLAGIRSVFEVENPKEVLQKLMAEQQVGIVILDKDSFEALDEFEQEKIGDSISPVFVVISEEESDKNLQRMIRKAIGVDVWER